MLGKASLIARIWATWHADTTYFPPSATAGMVSMEAVGSAANIVAAVDLLVGVDVSCSVYCADPRAAQRDVQ